MMKKFWLTLICIGSLFSTATFSTSTHTLTQGVSVEYELPVNEPQIFSNIFFWTIKASCTIVSENQQNPIFVTMLRKSGSVNNIELNAGASMDIIVQAGDKLDITATSGAKVQLVNKGIATIRAVCFTN